MKTYTGEITTLEPHEVFVFGSNTKGRHGKGAAWTAFEKFGAVYGQASGLQGQSYAIITKNLSSRIHPSIPKETIIEQIRALYVHAVVYDDKHYLIAYSIKPNLNGYTPTEMAEMFAEAQPIPPNVIFEREFAKLVADYIKTKWHYNAARDVKTAG